MTSCVRSESEGTSCGLAEDYCQETGRVVHEEYGQQEHGKSVKTIAGWRRLCRFFIRGWRRLCRLFIRKISEHLSPGCLDELIKSQVLKFSSLHQLDQLIQCRAQKIIRVCLMDSLCIRNNILCYDTGTILTIIRASCGVGRACFQYIGRPET